RLLRERNRSVDQRIPVFFGKADHADDRFAETRLLLESPAGKRLDVIFRCYNDAVALRYELPVQANSNSVTITDETTSFGVEGNPTAYAQYLENYTTSHEHDVSRVTCGDLRPDALLDMPLTLSWEKGLCAAITEAALRHYAGMALMRPAHPASPGEL